MFNWIKKLFNNKKTRFVSMTNSNVVFSSVVEEDNRADVKPIEIIHLLESNEDINLFDLKMKIKKMEERKRFYTETLDVPIPAEVEQAYNMLVARTKYKRHHKEFVWKTTSQEKVDELLKTYKLMHSSVSNFIYNLPDEAVAECEKFSKALTKVTNEQAVFSIIAPPKFFKDQRKDPILLAKAPFGDFYYILCAWDKEVDIVHELLYGEKLKDV